MRAHNSPRTAYPYLNLYPQCWCAPDRSQNWQNSQSWQRQMHTMHTNPEAQKHKREREWHRVTFVTTLAYTSGNTWKLWQGTHWWYLWCILNTQLQVFGGVNWAWYSLSPAKMMMQTYWCFLNSGGWRFASTCEAASTDEPLISRSCIYNAYRLIEMG